MSEGATRNQKKRCRTGETDGSTEATHGGFAASGASAICNAKPTSTKQNDQPSIVQGTRLEPIKDILKLQPTELNNTFIQLSSKMLDLYVTIKQ